ncbi:MAG: hypothetical protein L0196_02215, partial [candidate division Zixibacteria bacterium]|nr:hypothetical protein [candidate division Zixibacteria bacterium]
MRKGRFILFFGLGPAALAAGCLSTAKQVDPKASRELHLSYAFTAKIPSGSGKVDIWIPLPRSDGNQKLKSFKVASPLAYS